LEVETNRQLERKQAQIILTMHNPADHSH